jgi:hypothetical protein
MSYKAAEDMLKNCDILKNFPTFAIDKPMVPVPQQTSEIDIGNIVMARVNEG